MTETGSKETSEISIGDLALLITSASQLLTNLATTSPFKNANMGLAEWLTLSLLAERDGISNKQLARGLGVTGQRVNQICASLQKTGLIAIQQSSEDKRRNVIKVTVKGTRQVTAVNTELTTLLGVALKGRERTLKGAVVHLRRLMRLLQAANPAKAKASKTPE